MNQNHSDSSNNQTSDDIESERILSDVIKFLHEIDQEIDFADESRNDDASSASRNVASSIDSNETPSFEELYKYYAGQHTTPALSKLREQYEKTRVPLYARFPSEQSPTNIADTSESNDYLEMFHRHSENVLDGNGSGGSRFHYRMTTSLNASTNHESLNAEEPRGYFENGQELKYGSDLSQNANSSEKLQTHQFANIKEMFAAEVEQNTDFNLKTFNEMIPRMMTVGENHYLDAQHQQLSLIQTEIPAVEVERIRQENLNKLLQIQILINEKPDYIEKPPRRKQSSLVSPTYDAPQLSGAIKRKPMQKCTFCKKNGEPTIIYQSHSLKDFFGNLTCPILQKYTCEICGATGQNAHTLKYCPQRPKTTEATLPPFRLLANGVISTSHCHK